MYTSTRSRILGATSLLAVLLGAAACGDETVADPGSVPGYEARIYPPVSVPSAPVGKPGRVSADTAERLAKAQQERLDRAATLRWARGSQVEDQLQLRRGRP